MSRKFSFLSNALLGGVLVVSACFTSQSSIAAKRIDAPSPALTTGSALYLHNCAGCHGINAKGGNGPDLRRRTLGARAALVVKNGIKRKMPAFGSRLSGSQISEILAYVNSLPRG